jgi:hypothetical protein
LSPSSPVSENLGVFPVRARNIIALDATWFTVRLLNLSSYFFLPKMRGEGWREIWRRPTKQGMCINTSREYVSIHPVITILNFGTAIVSFEMAHSLCLFSFPGVKCSERPTSGAIFLEYHLLQRRLECSLQRRPCFHLLS